MMIYIQGQPRAVIRLITSIFRPRAFYGSIIESDRKALALFALVLEADIHNWVLFSLKLPLHHLTLDCKERNNSCLRF